MKVDKPVLRCDQAATVRGACETMQNRAGKRQLGGSENTGYRGLALASMHENCNFEGV
jgi:hypothetical protein